MPFVMFDVYTAQALGLNGTDSYRLAAELDALAAFDLAGRVRHGLANSALVELQDDTERETLVQALSNLLSVGAKQPEQVENLTRNVQARIAGADLPPPPNAA